MLVILLLCAGGLTYVYCGYRALLLALAKNRRAVDQPPGSQNIAITVLITAYNEESHIARRIENILACDYDKRLVRILVASDGSTDNTDAIVTGYRNYGVHLFRPEHRGGKSTTQNLAMETVTTEIVVFTDARTRFSPQFLTEIVIPFADPNVGCVDGHLIFLDSDAPITGATFDMAPAQGRYWRYELDLRKAESYLGMLAVASGACMAVRSRCFKPLPESIGEDCVIPLDIARQGLLNYHAAAAIAYDAGERNASEEFRARVRMTLRNWQGTWRYPDLLNPLTNPRIAAGLWSHKVLRWLSPLMIFGLWASSVTLMVVRSPYSFVGIPGVALLTLSALVVFLPATRKLDYLRLLWPFLVANAGFAVGVTRGILGNRITTYR